MKTPFIAGNALTIDRCYAFFSYRPGVLSPRSELCEQLVKEFGWCKVDQDGRHFVVHPDFVETYRRCGFPVKIESRKPSFDVDELMSPTERRVAERREKSRQLADAIYCMVRCNPYGKPRSTR